MRNRKIISIIIGILLVTVTVICVISYVNKRNSELEKSRLIKNSLDTGNKYLLEANYELAIAEYLNVINMDPNSVDAYTGIAKAYEELGNLKKEAKEYDAAIENYNSAIEYLQKALNITTDEATKNALNEQITKLQALITECTSLVTASEETDWDYLHDIMLATYNASAVYYDNMAITEEQAQAIFAPYLIEIEKNLIWDNFPERYSFEDWIDVLSGIYFHLGELDKSKELRALGYKMTGADKFAGDKYTKSFDDGTGTYNEYGEQTGWDGDSCVIYNEYEGNRLITEKHDEESFNYIRTYEYDSEGRRIQMTFDWHSQDGYNDTSITLYTYGDNTVTESYDDKDADGNIVKKEELQWTALDVLLRWNLTLMVNWWIRISQGMNLCRN